MSSRGRESRTGRRVPAAEIVNFRRVQIQVYTVYITAVDQGELRGV